MIQNRAGTPGVCQEDKSGKECKMSVEIETSALSMSKSLDSLKKTPLPMHRIIFEIVGTEKWYQIMAEARSQFGKNWRGQPRVKRKLVTSWNQKTVQVWFDVPDPSFATWCAVKLGVTAIERTNK